MRKFVCPGTFDPITNGHIDVISRASRLVDHLIVLVMDNEKKQTVLTLEERYDLVKRALDGMTNVSVDRHAGLLVDYAKTHGVTAVVKGIRNEVDYAYEYVMAEANRAMEPSLDTIFLPASGRLAYMSSSIVRSIAWFGGDITELVPPCAVDLIKRRYTKR
ncbi:MAG TPA: pantetheine-phosphate adenylyltransferase [Fastidiosipila sp.]|jgi:pantetheine-phosphate adenylyltransferase|nr:pantetheine-phosphate adenylyltransferase [Fastidiosipila sp.]